MPIPNCGRQLVSAAAYLVENLRSVYFTFGTPVQMGSHLSIELARYFYELLYNLAISWDLKMSGMVPDKSALARLLRIETSSNPPACIFPPLPPLLPSSPSSSSFSVFTFEK